MQGTESGTCTKKLHLKRPLPEIIPYLSLPSKPFPKSWMVPVEYDKVLSEAMNYQVKADSLNSPDC